MCHLGHDGVVAVVADVRRDLHPVTSPVLLADQVNLDTVKNIYLNKNIEIFDYYRGAVVLGHHGVNEHVHWVELVVVCTAGLPG